MLANRLKLIKIAVEMDDQPVVDYLVSNTDFTKRLTKTDGWVPVVIPFECSTTAEFWEFADTVAKLLCSLPYNDTLLQIKSLYIDLGDIFIDDILIDNTQFLSREKLGRHLFSIALTYEKYSDVFKKLYRLLYDNKSYIKVLFTFLGEKDIDLAYKLFTKYNSGDLIYYIKNKEFLTIILDNLLIDKPNLISLDHVRYLVSLDYLELARRYCDKIKRPILTFNFMYKSTAKELLFFKEVYPSLNYTYCKNSYSAGLCSKQIADVLEIIYKSVYPSNSVDSYLEKLCKNGITINKRTKKICYMDYELDITPEFIETIDNDDLRRDLNMILEDSPNFLYGSRYVT